MNEETRNLKMVLGYEGTRYAGFQRQATGILTIQGELEEALSRLTNETITIHAAGRTDAGVHARGQVVNFHTQSQMPCSKLQQALNSLLPTDILIQKVAEVPLVFHARYSVQHKTYSYRLVHGGLRPLFKRNFVYYYRHELKVELMQQAAELLVGTQDFATFQAAGSMVKTTIRTINFCKLVAEEAELLLTINANGFLYHMVRNIVGTLILVGSQRLSITDFKAALAKKDRSSAGPTAPAAGLCLEAVYYKKME